jgi:thioredoxin reductase (NADPH)
MEISYITSADEFELAKNSWPFLVVDFFSDECPPCEKLAPIYEKMALTFPSIKFIKIFRQQNRSIAEQLNVSGSPTIIFFRSGQLLEQRLSGEIEQNAFQTILESLSGEQARQSNINNQQVEEVDLCIIGNGPAGMTAAIYAARYKVNQLLIGDLPGGLMTSSHKICNFPSQTEISGMDLSQKMADQVVALNVPQKNTRIETIIKNEEGYLLTTSDRVQIQAKTLLLATGTKHRHLNVPNEQQLLGRGVSYCATCDAMFYANKTVAVIGGSDSANTAALYLAQIANKVYQIYRGSALHGETAWIDQIKQNDKITVIYNTQVKEFIGTDKLTAISIDKAFEDQENLLIDGAFIEIGSEPELHLIHQLSLETDASNYIQTKADQTTSQPGVWAAGDITTNSNSFRQIITACAEGAVAAQNVFTYLQGLK